MQLEPAFQELKKKERLSLLNRSQPNHETKPYQDVTPATSQAQLGNP